MFPSAGYFRGLPCPYYQFGLCERPYCHFKHVKPELSVNPSLKRKNRCSIDDDDTPCNNVSSPKLSSVPCTSMLSMVGKAIQHVEKEIEKDKHRVIHKRACTEVSSAGSLTRVTLDACSKNEYSGINDSGEYVPTKIGGPAYTPTPLVELKKRPASKYTLDSCNSAVDEHEYDPSSNFKATSIPPVKKDEKVLPNGKLSRNTSYLYVPTKQSKKQGYNDASELSDESDDALIACFSDNDDNSFENKRNTAIKKDSSDKKIESSSKNDNCTNPFKGDDLVSQILNASNEPLKIGVTHNQNKINIKKPVNKSDHKTKKDGKKKGLKHLRQVDLDLSSVNKKHLKTKDSSCSDMRKSEFRGNSKLKVSNGYLDPRDKRTMNEIDKVKKFSIKNEIASADDSDSEIKINLLDPEMFTLNVGTSNIKDGKISAKQHLTKLNEEVSESDNSYIGTKVKKPFSNHSSGENMTSRSIKHSLKKMKSNSLRQTSLQNDNILSHASEKKKCKSMQDGDMGIISIYSSEEDILEKCKNSHYKNDKSLKINKLLPASEDSKDRHSRSCNNQDFDVERKHSHSSKTKNSEESSSSDKHRQKKRSSSNTKIQTTTSSSDTLHEVRYGQSRSSCGSDENHCLPESLQNKTRKHHLSSPNGKDVFKSSHKHKSPSEKVKRSERDSFAQSANSFHTSPHTSSSKSIRDLTKKKIHNSHRQKEQDFDRMSSEYCSPKNLSPSIQHITPTKKRNLTDTSGDEQSSKKPKTSSVELFGADSDSTDSNCADSLTHNLQSDYYAYKRYKGLMSPTRGVPSDTSSVPGSLDEPIVLTDENNDSSYSPVDIFSDEILDEADHYAECLRIFNEKQIKKNKRLRLASPKKRREPEVIIGKKRLAHKEGDFYKAPAVKIKPTPRTKMPTPAEVMQNRLLQMQKQRLSSVKAKDFSRLSHKKVPSSKRRLAPETTLTKYGQLDERKPSPIALDSDDDDDDDEFTPCQTASKLKTRVAHIPKKKVLKRPVIQPDPTSKVPSNVRMRYLNLLIDECMKIYDDEQDAQDRAVSEEKAIFDRSTSKTVYLNVAVNAIKKIRHELNSHEDESVSANRNRVSHQAMLGGQKATTTSFTVHRSNSRNRTPVKLTDAMIYEKLSGYLMLEEQLIANGYPASDPDIPGSALIVKSSEKSKLVGRKSHEKICRRCGKGFFIYPNGTYQSKEECTYHWGKAWKQKIDGLLDTRYNCCQGDLNSQGCVTGKLHVHDTNKMEDLKGYMKTFPCSPPVDGNYGFYSIDCEMVYTTKGLELARVTVLDRNLESAYETLVQPEKPVIDYNTRFSGITEEDLQDVSTTLRDVQAVLLSLFSAETIVLGHSLESDLVALKLIHRCVVDTSIVFPHRLGPPYKRALRTLMAEILNKIIQDDVGGHDSHEDAGACMELMLWKIKEDMKGRRL